MPLIYEFNNEQGKAIEVLGLGQRRFDLETKSSNDDFIYVPSIKLYVAKERTLLGENWNECQEELHSKNQRMPTIPEFSEFLKYTKENHQDIYKEITEIKIPWRSEWLDADFKMQGKDLSVNYHIFDSDGRIIKKLEKLDKNTLMKDKTPGISLASWLNNSTNQGLPQKSVISGDLYYWVPMKDNNSVAEFYAVGVRASLDCGRNPSVADCDLGVRAAKLRE